MLCAHRCKKDYLDGVGDTLDLVPIAAFYGKGKRTGAYGAYVLACYDDESEEYQSITKIGTGFSEEDITKHAAFYNQPHATDPSLPPPNLLPACPRYYKLGDTLKPDVWLAPVAVWEVKCADLSISPVHQAAVGRVDEGKGIALRFPRFVRVRDDKKPEVSKTQTHTQSQSPPTQHSTAPLPPTQLPPTTAFGQSLTRLVWCVCSFCVQGCNDGGASG